MKLKAENLIFLIKTYENENLKNYDKCFLIYLKLFLFSRY